ncbi:Transmembrane channel-like protein 3 [Hypsibius exemplaris]|uniref:Transmembrane channel-like protein 3 n=1 Tax=Hypsibius exemplaris TaxID=2072580 RepID=A0A1W0X3U1_HYPEX|nr:Transmembrane channel-like protein 3 [Hypsibius exemplaris]
MDPNRPWLSGRPPSSAYPGRLPVTGPLPVALPGLEIHHRDPRFVRQPPHSSDESDEFPLPTYEETWSDAYSENLSRVSMPFEPLPPPPPPETTSVHRSNGSRSSGDISGPPFHLTTLPTLQPNDRRSSSSSDLHNGAPVPPPVEVVVPPTSPTLAVPPVQPRKPSETPSSKDKKKKKGGFFGKAPKARRRKSKPFLAGIATAQPRTSSDGVLLIPRALGSGSTRSRSGSTSLSGSSESGSGSGTGSGSSYTGTTTTTSSSDSESSYDSDDDYYRPFLDHLDEEMQESLRDGEDFDYIGLVAHPTAGQEESKLKDNLDAMKDIVRRVKDQPWRMRRKLKLFRLGHVYIERYEGRLSAGRANVAFVGKFFKLLRRNLDNLFALLMPWEERIKSIENRFGSAAASYFILLRWIIGVNVLQTLFIVGFVMVPHIIFGDKDDTTFRTTMTTKEVKNGLEWDTIYHYAGYMLYTPIYYGYYGDEKKYSFGYRLPLAYFVTTVAIFVHSYWVVLSKMATNVREGTGSGGSDQYVFSTRSYCSWDYMIANRDTGDNKVAAVSRSFKELILDEHHKGREENKWMRLFLRILAWIITGLLLALSVWILMQVMEWKRNFKDPNPTFFQSNIQSLSLKGIGMVFPEMFERLEHLEEFHPLTALRVHLTRITMLNLLTNYALINTWIIEANEMYHESTHAKAAFPWIWNATYYPRPTDWETQTFDPNSHGAAGGHGAPAGDHGEPANQGHGAPAAGHGEPASGGHGAPVATAGHAAPVAAGHGAAASSEGHAAPATGNSHGAPVANGHGQPQPSSGERVTTSPNAHGAVPANGHGGAPETAIHAPPPTTNHDVMPEGRTTHGPPPPALTLRKPDFSLGVNDPFGSLGSSHIKPLDTVHGTVSDHGVPSDSHGGVPSDIHAASGDGHSDHVTTTTTEVPEVYDATTLINEAVSDGVPPVFNRPPNGVTNIPGGNFRPPMEDPNATHRTYSFVPRTTAYVNTWPTLPIITRPPTTPAPPRTTTEPIITIEKLKSFCWENKVAFEGLENLVTESITGVLEVIVVELLRDAFVRFMAKCWFWDLETVPGYAQFRISENVLGLIVGQQMTWIAFFFAPALIPINLTRLLFLMYFRSWVTHVCCVPPETMFNTGKGNNFYFFILLLMLFVSTLFIGYTVFFLSPSWQCGPFSQYKFIYEVTVDSIGKVPALVTQITNYLSSPALIVPIVLMLAIIIFYLITVRMALVKHTKDLKRTLEIERTEERRKMLAQLEEKKKRAQQKLLGATNVTGEDLQVTIEQANENTKSLLDKMQNRGFPPEENPGPSIVQRRKSSLFRAGEPPPSLKSAAQTVIVMNGVARRLSQLSDAAAPKPTPAVTPQAEPASTVSSSVLLSAKVARSKEKFKRKRKNMPPVMETEETVTETVIDMQDIEDEVVRNASPTAEEEVVNVSERNSPARNERAAPDSESIRTA